MSSRSGSWRRPKNWHRPNGREPKNKHIRRVACGHGTVSSPQWDRLQLSWLCWRECLDFDQNQNEARAEANFNQAEAQRLALEANCLLAAGGSSEQIALLSLRSMNTRYTDEGDAVLSAAARLDYPAKSYNQGSPVWSVEFSPDGKYILVGGDNKTVKLWDFQTGQELQRFIGHRARFSPDGKHVLTESFSEGVGMWDWSQGGKYIKLLRIRKYDPGCIRTMARLYGRILKIIR